MVIICRICETATVAVHLFQHVAAATVTVHLFQHVAEGAKLLQLAKQPRTSSHSHNPINVILPNGRHIRSIAKSTLIIHSALSAAPVSHLPRPRPPLLPIDDSRSVLPSHSVHSTRYHKRAIPLLLLSTPALDMFAFSMNACNPA